MKRIILLILSIILTTSLVFAQGVAQWSETSYLPESIAIQQTCIDTSGNSFTDNCEGNYGIYKFTKKCVQGGNILPYREESPCEKYICEKEFYYCIDYYYKTCSNGACKNSMSESEISNLKDFMSKWDYSDKCEQNFEFNKGENTDIITAEFGADTRRKYTLTLKNVEISNEESAIGQKATIEVNGVQKEFKINEFQEIAGLHLLVAKIFRFHGKNMVWGCLFESSERKAEAKCIGCWDEKSAKCYPSGKRIVGDKYCSDYGRILDQKLGKESCTEHYECTSNLCDPKQGICLDTSFWGKIWIWLSGIFS